MKGVYLDWAATALIGEDIFQASLKGALEYQGNPSSQHREGFLSRDVLNDCRSRCARVLNCETEQLYFTSGGTESNNLVMLSQFLNRVQGRLIVSSLEHPAIMEPSLILKKSGADLKILRPDKMGMIQPETLRVALDGETRLVSLMAVHNETGVIQPLEALISTVRDFQKNEGKRPIHIHSDMVQAPGKIAIDLTKLGLDSASFSAHKIRGPKGSGLLYLKKPLPVLYRGGGQERGIRPGTESIQNALAMTLSLEKWGHLKDNNPDSQAVYSRALEKLKMIEGLVFNPPARSENPGYYVPQIINFSLPPLPGEVLQRILDERGFYVSTGSACSSNKKSQTQGLVTMGISEKTAHCSIRISMGPTTTEDNIDRFITVLDEIKKEFIC